MYITHYIGSHEKGTESAAREIGQDIMWLTGLCMRLLCTLRYTLGMSDQISRETIISSNSLVPQLLDFTAFMVYVKKISRHYNNSGTGLFKFQLYSVLTISCTAIPKDSRTALVKTRTFFRTVYISATWSRQHKCQPQCVICML